VYISTLYHSLAMLMPFLTTTCAILLPFTTKTTNDTTKYPFYHLYPMELGFTRHHTWVGNVAAWFYASNSTHIYCSPSVPFSIYWIRGTPIISSLSQDSCSFTSMTTLFTVLTAPIMMSWYHMSISTVTFRYMIALITTITLKM